MAYVTDTQAQKVINKLGLNSTHTWGAVNCVKNIVAFGTANQPPLQCITTDTTGEWVLYQFNHKLNIQAFLFNAYNIMFSN